MPDKDLGAWSLNLMPSHSPFSPKLSPHSYVGISFNIFMTFNGNFEFIASEYYEMTVSMNVYFLDSKSLGHVAGDFYTLNTYILDCEDFAWTLFTRSITANCT